MRGNIRTWRKILVCGGLAVFLMAVSNLPAYGAAKENIAVEIPVRQVFHGDEGKETPEGIFEYEMTAQESGAPMPEGSKDGVYGFSMKGTESRKIGMLVFEHGGIWSYQIRQQISDKKENYIYDPAIYTIEIYVKNSERGLTAEMIIMNESGSKCDEVGFENTYTRGKTETTPVPTIDVASVKTSGVKTGDENPVGGYAGLLLMSLFLIGAVGTFMFMQGVYHNTEADDR